jgi:hypothetical protein
MIVTIGSSASVLALKAYLGVGPGMLLDATLLTIFANIERIVLAAFLATKEILYDSALFGKLATTTNLLEKLDRTLYKGVDNFIIRIGNVVAIQFDLPCLRLSLEPSLSSQFYQSRPIKGSGG